MRHHILDIILTMAAGVTCMTSCTNEYVPSGPGENARMIFEAGGLSRTPVTYDSTLIDNSFRLFGGAQRRGEFFKGFRELFNDTEVKYDETGNMWDYGTPQYWEMGQEHSFVALHPYDIPGMSHLEYKENHEVTFTYTMPEKSDDERDILFATHRRMYNMDESDPVRFNFKHLLTKINVAPALSEDLMYGADDETKKDYEFDYDLIKNEFIEIRRVELIGFRTVAHVSVKPAELGEDKRTDESVVTVKINEEDGELIAFDFPSEAKPYLPRVYNNGKNVSVLDKDDPIVVIPQTIDEGAALCIKYTVNRDSIDDQIRSLTFPLQGPQKLEFGKFYTLKFTIEKVYAGQIKPGSLTWVVTEDARDHDKNNEDWIKAGPDDPDNPGPYDEDGVIRQEFGEDEGEVQEPDNSENDEN